MTFSSAIDHASRRTASVLITVYQRQLSPHKGFSCAHRLVHRGESCSQYVKRAILEQGLGEAIPLIRQRFQDCKTASQILRRRAKVRMVSAIDQGPESEPQEPSEEQPRSGKAVKPVAGQGVSPGSSYTDCGNGCSSTDCSTGLDCANFSCDALDCGASDWSLPDCSGLDCSGCDCGSCSW